MNYGLHNINANNNYFSTSNKSWLYPRFISVFWRTVSYRSVTENFVFSLLLRHYAVIQKSTMRTALLHISLDLNSAGIVYRRQCLFSESWTSKFNAKVHETQNYFNIKFGFSVPVQLRKSKFLHHYCYRLFQHSEANYIRLLTTLDIV